MGTKNRTTTWQERMAALNGLKIACERKIRINDSAIYRKYRTSGLVTKMLETGFIKPTTVHNVYRWDAGQTTVDEIISLVWSKDSGDLSGIDQAYEKMPLEPQTPAQPIGQIDQVMKAVEMVNKYKIAEAAQFIFDYSSGLIFKQ